MANLVNRLQKLLPPTLRRVELRTAPHVEERIRMQTLANILHYALTSPDVIDQRISELEREWDTERALETGSAIQIFLGLALGTFVNRRWFAWPGIIAGFLLMHALAGWCPPIAVLRRRGFRTTAEINEEIEALRILRGDFHPTDDPQDAITQARTPHHARTGPVVPAAMAQSGQ